MNFALETCAGKDIVGKGAVVGTKSNCQQNVGKDLANNFFVVGMEIS